MFATWVRSLGVVGILVMIPAVDGRTVSLVDGSGNAVGWTATIPDGGQNDSIQLSFVRSAGGVYFFNKTAAITNIDSPLVIEFARTSASAPTLAIGTEFIANQSDRAWIGYRTFVSTATAAGSSGVGFQLSASPEGGFNVNPFTRMVFTNNNTEMLALDGVVDVDETYRPGNPETGGLLILSANPSDDRFLLKEMPVVPVPAAVWTGVSTLLCLGGLGVVRRRARSA